MKSSYYIQCVLLTCACITTTSYADCVADISVADAKRYFQQGSQLESRGDVYAALVAYNTAQGYVCEDGGNPVAKSASQKASALGSALGEKAERQGHFYTVDDNKPGAFQYYEAGAHFAAADRMLVAALQQDPANRSLSATAQEHFRTRGEAYFTANNAMRLAVSGAYRLNPDHVRYVQSLPRINIDQLLKQASAQLPDTYLLEYRQLEEQKEKLEPSDFVASLQLQKAATEFQQKWRSDRLEDLRKIYDTATSWTQQMQDHSEAETMRTKIAAQKSAQADKLLNNFADIPNILETAVNFYYSADNQNKVAAAQKRAGELAEIALREERFARAAHYYRINGDYAQETAAEKKLQAQMEATAARMSAGYADQATELQKYYSDPDKIQALQREALKIQQSLQQKQQQNEKNFKQEQDALEAELGL